MVDGSAPSPLRVFSALAVHGALNWSILPRFGAEMATAIETVFAPTSLLGERINGGARFDVIVAIDDYVRSLARVGIVGRPVAVASTCAGIAVARGAVRPSIGTIEALRSALLDARSVAYSRTGASGLFFARLLDRLGIADAVNARATILPEGLTGEALLDGRADLAVQQLSELRSVPGIDVVGPMPAELDSGIVLAAAVHVAAPDPLARHLLAALSGPDAQDAYRRFGLDIPERRYDPTPTELA